MDRTKIFVGQRRRTTTNDEKVEFYNLAATLSVAVSCRRLFNEFSDKRKLKTWTEPGRSLGLENKLIKCYFAIWWVELGTLH